MSGDTIVAFVKFFFMERDYTKTAKTVITAIATDHVIITSFDINPTISYKCHTNKTTGALLDIPIHCSLLIHFIAEWINISTWNGVFGVNGRMPLAFRNFLDFRLPKMTQVYPGI